MEYPKDIDSECVYLCDALNSIPHVLTVESCCGHGKESFDIWFNCYKNRQLLPIARSISRNYSSLMDEWSLFVAYSDLPERPIFFQLSSNNIKGERAYEESKIIANNIYGHMRNIAFIDGFGIETRL